MTGFDPTAPARDTDEDEADRVPDNVVPPESLANDGEAPAPTEPDASRDDE